MYLIVKVFPNEQMSREAMHHALDKYVSTVTSLTVHGDVWAIKNRCWNERIIGFSVDMKNDMDVKDAEELIEGINFYIGGHDREDILCELEMLSNFNISEDADRLIMKTFPGLKFTYKNIAAEHEEH